MVRTPSRMRRSVLGLCRKTSLKSAVDDIFVRVLAIVRHEPYAGLYVCRASVSAGGGPSSGDPSQHFVPGREDARARARDRRSESFAVGLRECFVVGGPFVPRSDSVKGRRPGPETARSWRRRIRAAPTAGRRDRSSPKVVRRFDHSVLACRPWGDGSTSRDDSGDCTSADERPTHSDTRVPTITFGARHRPRRTRRRSPRGRVGCPRSGPLGGRGPGLVRYSGILSWPIDLA